MSELWSHLVSWLAIHGVQPVLQSLHLEKLSSDPNDIAAALLVATLQLCIIGVIFRPLESVMPAEKWEHRQLVGPDFRYTVAMLIGIFPLFSYLILTPIANFFGGPDTGPGDPSASPLALTHWVPWLRQHPWLLFAIYYMVYDCVYYWMHRLQHALPWWWAMHSMHHSTRQMSCWTNDRGSLIDGFLQSMVLATVGIVMGVEPDEFAWLMLTGELVQNFSHANVNISFGPVFRRVLVAPTFHRLHHMLVDPDRPKLHNCNFGQVFSIWDQLFGTALYDEPLRPTGVGDPMVDEDNNHGVIGLQWNAFKRFWGAVRRPAGWKFGEVAFGPDYRPIPVDQLDLHALGHHVMQPAAHAAAAATNNVAAKPSAESATVA
ncbi:fatty acid hydroxylase family protein [Dyella solisilvae]|uniref:Fatty acid hydroxylase family protein n=1 Tax=Dyella solisilvae TaxID=1920168 RepID=A0A370KCD3_9GAMM|nr:sterol desaturase family protein [Dyella solisilvae]RDJ00108.1 fatty acid hydroxylase family protein [Dyella solisilvae]